MDDDPEVAELLRFYLETLFGLSVLVANSGEEAIAIAADRPGLIEFAFLDYSMPGGMDGGVTFAALREMEPSLRAVVLTAFNVRDATGLLSEGLRGIYGKPVTPELLQELLRTHAPDLVPGALR